MLFFITPLVIPNPLICKQETKTYVGYMSATLTMCEEHTWSEYPHACILEWYRLSTRRDGRSMCVAAKRRDRRKAEEMTRKEVEHLDWEPVEGDKIESNQCAFWESGSTWLVARKEMKKTYWVYQCWHWQRMHMAWASCRQYVWGGIHFVRNEVQTIVGMKLSQNVSA